MSSLIDSVVNFATETIETAKYIQARQNSDNAALVKRAQGIAQLAKCILISSVCCMAIQLALFPLSSSLLTYCAIEYVAYEILAMARNTENHLKETSFIWWNHDKGFGENLLLNQLSSPAKFSTINKITTDAPITRLVLTLYYY